MTVCCHQPTAIHFAQEAHHHVKKDIIDINMCFRGSLRYNQQCSWTRTTNQPLGARSLNREKSKINTLVSGTATGRGKLGMRRDPAAVFLELPPLLMFITIITDSALIDSTAAQTDSGMEGVWVHWTLKSHMLSIIHVLRLLQELSPDFLCFNFTKFVSSAVFELIDQKCYCSCCGVFT